MESKSKQKGFIFVEDILMLLYAIVVLLSIYGYGANIYYIFKCDFEAPYKEEIIRGTGLVIFPVGIVAGYVDLSNKETEH